MQLKKLEIELQEYGEQRGNYEVEITYLHERSETKLFLPPEISGPLMQVIAAQIIAASKATAARLAESLPDTLYVPPPIETRQITDKDPGVD